MNTKDMRISFSGGGLLVEYECGVVEKAEIKEATGEIIFYFRDGQILVQNVTNHVFPDTVYLRQFGLSITLDGKHFFIQSWEKGLFCFEVQTGTLVWHNTRKKASQLVVRNNTVICRFFDQCIDAIDISFGLVITHYPLGCGTDFLPISDDYYLVGPKRGKYFIIDGKLDVFTCIPYQIMNPLGYDTFIVNNVDFISGGIMISGFEYMFDEQHCKWRDGKFSASDNDILFSRNIEIAHLEN